MRKERLLLSLLPLSLLFGAFGIVSAACGGSTSTSSGPGGSSAAGGDCFDYTTFDAGATVSFKTDVLPIWQGSCGLSTSCHGNPTPGVMAQHYLGPNNMTTVTSAEITTLLAGVVGVTSIDEPDMDVIKAGDPAHSFMMYKLDGDPNNPTSGVSCTKLQCATTMPNGCLEPMPQGTQLPQMERDLIRSWIAQGALNN
jgi:hypothetical protein